MYTYLRPLEVVLLFPIVIAIQDINLSLHADRKRNTELKSVNNEGFLVTMKDTNASCDTTLVYEIATIH